MKQYQALLRVAWGILIAVVVIVVVLGSIHSGGGMPSSYGLYP
jgi:preprotein translocase subunit SecG